ncbi:MAG TPA: spore cortex biosynthesis protein YabQ, partial [Sporomusaceae bacterium]|nr:spore cortex biosynthesis protein YabQ [Sporomusaceae bacterium]
MELYGQIQIFLVTLLTGAFLGIIFDFDRVLRGVFRP